MQVKSSLQKNLTQKQSLHLTSAMQTSLRILQLNQLELQMEIVEALNSNIMLELEDHEDYNIAEQVEQSLMTQNCENDVQEDLNHTESEQIVDLDLTQDYVADVETDWDSSENWENSYQFDSQNEENQEFVEVEHETLQQFLLWQLEMSKLSARDYIIAEYLIDLINDEGYLLVDLKEILMSLQPVLEDVESDEIIAVLKRIQFFEPTGVGARSLTECLLLQIRQLQPQPEWANTAVLLLTQYHQHLIKLDFNLLRRSLKVDEEWLRFVLRQLRCLNPKPGLAWGTQETAFSPPDVIVTIENHTPKVVLNSEVIPRLKVNQHYAKIATLAQKESSLLKQHLHDATFFIKSVENRFDTLLKVATAIVKYQRAFFLQEGEHDLHPLQMKTIADELSIHESTVSRAVMGKTLFCTHGLYDLKFFFSNSVGQNSTSNVTDTASGGHLDSDSTAISAVAIKAALRKLIQDEDKRKPLSDNKLVELLAKQDLVLARRTVAKYREALGFASSSERKIL